MLRELAKNGAYAYRFFGSHDDVSGIKAFRGDDLVVVKPLNFSVRGDKWRLRGYWPAVLDRSAKALIIIGNPNMAASWWAAVVARLLGKKVLFWAHGWLKPEPALKRMVRNIYFSLANLVLVYGERAVSMAERSGFNSNRIRVIYNSLDYDLAQDVLREIEAPTGAVENNPQALFPHPDRPLLICAARLTSLCRFDLLIDAAANLQRCGDPVNILLVGDGPERGSLEQQAAREGVSVHFFGACYDEEILGNLIYHSDLTVSPGKIGLSVIHSLTYGTPAITHGDMDEQMPEAEAIEPGKSGAFFDRNSADDLSRVVHEWLRNGRPRDEIRRDCQRIIAEKWNPASQRRRIEAALDELFLK